MNKKQAIFKLNTKEAISFDFPNNIDAMYPCDEIVIRLFMPNENYILSIDCIRENMESLYYLLTEALDNKAKLDTSITKDIGYLWNEEMQDKPGLVYNQIEGMQYWVGLRNNIWSTPSNCKPILSSWLYNDLSGSIILEITPSYPWHTKDPEENEQFSSYDEWIKMYQPLLIRTISHSTAMNWKKQAKAILDQLNENVRKFNLKK
jgi:hypothetical protein